MKITNDLIKHKMRKKQNLMRSISIILKHKMRKKQNLMRSISIFFICTVALISCSKTLTQEQYSNELLITIEDECYAKITFYKHDSSFYAKEFYDCNYTNELYIKIEAGKYRIVAESSQRKKEILFEKTRFHQTLNIIIK